MNATTSATAIEQEQVEAFAGRVVGDIAATMSTIFVALGDKLGLFAALASGGPASGSATAGASTRGALRPAASRARTGQRWRAW